MEYLEALQIMMQETGGLNIDVWLKDPANIRKVAEQKPVDHRVLGGEYSYALQWLRKYCGLADKDEVIKFCTSDASFVACSGRRGLAVFRKGKLIGLYGYVKLPNDCMKGREASPR